MSQGGVGKQISFGKILFVQNTLKHLILIKHYEYVQLKNDAKRQKNKRKADKKRQKIIALRKYYEEQVRIIKE